MEIHLQGKPANEHISPVDPRLKTAFDLCIAKTGVNIEDFSRQTKTWSHDVNGRFENYKEDFYEIGNWTSSFFTGMALIAWQETEDENFLNQVLRLAPRYREKVFTRHLDTHHDLGFLASLYSVGLYKLTGDEQHREVGVRAAEVLSQRFNEKSNFLRAWGHLNTCEHNNLAIIDSLMNLPLLHWASRETNDRKYADFAVRHADMALKCFVRSDDSVNHAYRFNLETGQPLGAENFCGFSKESHWARGTTWAVYGFALSYTYTGDKKYLDASLRLARKFIEQLDELVVPVWDFSLPPEATRERDSSAAAIMVCGLQELAKHQAADAAMLQTKTALLHHLCSDDYLDFNPACRGILKKGQTGSGLGQARYSYTSWGDYFLMEALNRELRMNEPFW